jgi:hypothetical protein
MVTGTTPGWCGCCWCRSRSPPRRAAAAGRTRGYTGGRRSDPTAATPVSASARRARPDGVDPRVADAGGHRLHQESRRPVDHHHRIHAAPISGGWSSSAAAADAQLARVHLPAAAEANRYPEDTWLQLEGTVVPGTSTAETNFIPTMAVSSAKRIDKPTNTYAY